MKLTRAHERKVYSQHGEDGITLAILSEIGLANGCAVEIGSGDGRENNTRVLKEQRGFRCWWFDRDFGPPVIQARIDRDNVQSVLTRQGVVRQPDVLSLDIDGNDWWVLAHMGPFVPRLLICEYNDGLGKEFNLSIPYQPDFEWRGTKYFGASLVAMHRLGQQLGLALVYIESSGTNLFFVDREYAPRFEDADNLEALYRHTPWSWPTEPRVAELINPFSAVQHAG